MSGRPSHHHATARPHAPAGAGFLLFLAALALLAAGGCGRAEGPPPDGADLPLAVYAPHQQRQVATDLISVPLDRNLDRLEFGWGLHEVGAAGGAAEMPGRMAQISFFSPDGDVARLLFEVSLAAGDAAPEGGIGLFFLATGCRRRIEPGADWESHAVRLGPDCVRAGDNLLELRRPAAREDSQAPLRLRHLRFEPAAGGAVHPPRATRLEIETRPAAGEELRTVRMPAGSFFDAVLELPPDGRLEVRARAADGSRGEAAARVTLLGPEGPARTLAAIDLAAGGPSVRRESADLSSWSGETIRLRLAAAGAPTAAVEWIEPRIRNAAAAGPPEPIGTTPVEPSGRLGRPDVFVVLLDAARADAFSPFGGPHESPAFERLAAAGTVFSHALSPSPWTGQTVPALFTGFYPDSVGIESWASRLPAAAVTLAEIVSAAGYSTLLWTQHPFYGDRSDLRRGFSRVFDASGGSYAALPDAGDLLAGKRPLFAFLHLIPPHNPYEPPAPFRGRYSSWYRGAVEPDGPFLNSIPDARGAETLSEEDVRYVRDRYLENAAFADSLLGTILDRLAAAGRFEEALVIVLSDHGESFMEHGRFLHTHSLYRELLHVPLIFKWPASSTGHRRAVNAPVSLVDVVPTLIDGLGLEAPPEGFQGVSLMPAAFGGAAPVRPLYAVTRGRARSDVGPRPSAMLERDGWRALFDPIEDRVELYRSADDPAERTDLASRFPGRALWFRQAIRMQQHANRTLRAAPEVRAAPPEMDPEVEKRLKALGYL